MQATWQELSEKFDIRSSVTNVTIVMTSEDIVNMVGASMFGNMVGDFSAIIAVRYLTFVNSGDADWRNIANQIIEKCETEYLWLVK